MAVEWREVTVAGIRAKMSVGMRTYYDAWVVANPDKATALQEIIDEVVDEYRRALLLNAANVLDPDATKVPLSCYRHARRLIVGALAEELEWELNAAERSAYVRSEIHLRNLQTGLWPLVPDDSAGLPRYTPGSGGGYDSGEWEGEDE